MSVTSDMRTLANAQDRIAALESELAATKAKLEACLLECDALDRKHSDAIDGSFELLRRAETAEAKLADAERDAGRYRYLRDSQDYDYRDEPENWCRAYKVLGDASDPAAIDKAIDAAIKADAAMCEAKDSGGVG